MQAPKNLFRPLATGRRLLQTNFNTPGSCIVDDTSLGPNVAAANAQACNEVAAISANCTCGTTAGRKLLSSTGRGLLQPTLTFTGAQQFFGECVPKKPIPGLCPWTACCDGLCAVAPSAGSLPLDNTYPARRCKEDFFSLLANCNYVFDAASAGLRANLQIAFAGNTFVSCTLFYDDGSYVDSTTCFTTAGDAPTVVRLNAKAVRFASWPGMLSEQPCLRCGLVAEHRGLARRSSTQRTPALARARSLARASRRRPSSRRTTLPPTASASA